MSTATMELLKATIGALKDKYGDSTNADLQIPIAELEARLAADTQRIAELSEATANKGKRGKRAKKEPSLPSTMREELAYNPHLRADPTELALMCGCAEE